MQLPKKAWALKSWFVGCYGAARLVVCLFFNQTQLSVCDILAEAKHNRQNHAPLQTRHANIRELSLGEIVEAKYAERIQQVPAYGPHLLSTSAEQP